MDPPAVSLVADLRVKTERLTVLRAEKSTERRSLFLSNIDQKLVGYILKFVHFFSGHQEIEHDAIIYLHTEALSRILVPYDFMSGRLRFDFEHRRFEIDCNAAGLSLADCISDLALEELGDISYPNPAFSQLCILPGSTNQKPEDEPLITFQVTRFKCGGFTLGTAVNHSIMDGFALQEFAKNLAHLARKGNVAFVPVTDRTCLKARSTLYISTTMKTLAHLWRAGTASMANTKADDISTVQFAVDIRSKMKPPLPREYAGNATVTAYTKATTKELTGQPFSVIVKKLEEGADRLSDEYVRSRIDWLELHDGVICLENGFLVTSWSHMGFGDVEFGGGIKSLYAGSVVTGRVDVVIFMADPKDEGGIKIYIGLEPAQMARFRLLIQNVDVDATIRSNL